MATAGGDDPALHVLCDAEEKWAGSRTLRVTDVHHVTPIKADGAAGERKPRPRGNAQQGRIDLQTLYQLMHDQRIGRRLQRVVAQSVRIERVVEVRPVRR